MYYFLGSGTEWNPHTHKISYKRIYLCLQILYNGTGSFTKFVNTVLSHPKAMNRFPLCYPLLAQHLQKEMYPHYCNVGT